MFSVSEKISFIESIFGKGSLSTNGKNFSVRCPICAPTDPNKKKLAIRVTDDAHHCWTCGWKSYTLAPLIKRFSTQSALALYRDKFKPERRVTDEEEKGPPPITLPEDFFLIGDKQDSKDPDVRAAWNYLLSRGVSERDAWFYKIGISKLDQRWKRRVIFPSFDEEGLLNFFVARNVDTWDRRPKWDNPDANKFEIVFNGLNINWSKEVIICEGLFDALKCGENSIPLLGSDFSTNSLLFSQIIMNGTPVILSLDGDMWESKTPRLAKLLRQFDVQVSVVDTRGMPDPGSVSKRQFKEALDRAISPDWGSLFFDRLDFCTRTKLKI
jgi:hypothetical protein